MFSRFSSRNTYIDIYFTKTSMYIIMSLRGCEKECYGWFLLALLVLFSMLPKHPCIWVNFTRQGKMIKCGILKFYFGALLELFDYFPHPGEIDPYILKSSLVHTFEGGLYSFKIMIYNRDISLELWKSVVCIMLKISINFRHQSTIVDMCSYATGKIEVFV